jgi:two-component system chemotaxis response regulator CheY
MNDIKILIAEDDPISRKMLQKLLRNFWTGEVLVANDGQEAWEILQTDLAPLVIVDWMMPRMNGIELCRKIRDTRFERYVYTILLTARDDQGDVLEGLAAGADDYVRKPFNPQELQLRIKAALRVIELERELAEKNVELQGLNLRLEELARVDPLMKIANRHSFHETVERVHSQFLRYGQNYGMLMCDVDYFKQYNDTLGHQAGDDVLRKVAGAIKANIRQADEAFRYGGEEIVVLLPNQDVEGTIRTSERLCRSVFEAGIAHPRGIEGKVSISIGATACSRDNSAPTWNEILEQADQALYRAKQEGRNRLCYYGRSEVSGLTVTL